MGLLRKTATGLTYAALVAFYGAFIVGGIYFLWQALGG